MIQNEKITADTEFDTWFGETTSGQKCAITEIDLLEVTSLLANVEDSALRELGVKLFEAAKNDVYLVMHDGTRLAKTLRAALDNGLTELSQELTQDAKNMNLNNGFLDCDPWL